MTSLDETRAVLERAGAVLQGHFRYASGLHGPLYIEKFRLLEDPVATATLCTRIAGAFQPQQVECVVGPTTGGILVAYEIARQMGVHVMIAESGADGAGRELRRGFRMRPGLRTLVVDDVLTTGGSIRDTMAAVETAGGISMGVGVLVDRTAGRTDFGVPFASALALEVEAYAPQECPLCRDGVTLVET